MFAARADGLWGNTALEWPRAGVQIPETGFRLKPVDCSVYGLGGPEDHAQPILGLAGLGYVKGDIAAIVR